MANITPEEVWEIAKKITYIDKIGGFTSKEFNEIFDGMNRIEVMNLSIEDVKAFIDDYEEKKKIKVGDIVASRDCTKYLVLDKSYDGNDEIFCLFSENGCVEHKLKSYLSKVTSTDLIQGILSLLQM